MKRHFILFSSPSQTPQITWSLIEQSFYHCSLGLINLNDYIAKNIIRYMYMCIFIFLNTMHSFIYYLTVFTFTFLHVFPIKSWYPCLFSAQKCRNLSMVQVFFYVFHKRNVLKSCFKCILWLHYMYKYMALIKLIL